MLDIDTHDRALLSALQADARVSLDNLAHLTGLSPATVQRRVRRLRESGVIKREAAILDADALGWGMSFLILVEMERERLDMLDAFKRRMRAEQQVQQCYYITGDADFALICLARDMNDFERLTQRLFFDDSNIRRFRTSVVMDRTKVSLNIGTENEG
ncbi:Lrp/AsnC family transcriptional regulator [Thalassobius sp. I31.1]|uniref:Lrp/AsnC family transcriptional regulator n=1 Tax=Thalassobius sp. I31.1 TaxID=2109912 RepID=UPI000D1ACE6D|nr:Lrp/AsnC family transcriptional regulator [Thalassobius sp. I31.1]